MATHSPKQGGMSTDMLGAVIDAVRVTFGASGAPTLVAGGKSNLIQSVTRSAQGRYVFQLNPNYYRSVIAILPSSVLPAEAPTGAHRFARYLEGSYSSTTGQFEVDTLTTPATPALADPVNGTALDLVIVFQRLPNY